MDVNKLMRSLAAKTNPNDSAQWLPLWMHARDTAGIMEKLWKHWLPAAVRREICGGSEEALQENEVLFQKVCVFLGMAHDIGKATAVFQARILEMLPEVRERLAEEGLEIPSYSGTKEKETLLLPPLPHALAGEVILRQYKINEGICEIVGAHHGKPQENVGEDTFYAHLYSFRGEDKDAELWALLWKELLRYALEVSGIKMHRLSRNSPDRSAFYSRGFSSWRTGSRAISSTTRPFRLTSWGRKTCIPSVLAVLGES